MTERDALLALAERVERLEGPDREVDARIWCVVGNDLGHDDPPHRHRLMRPLQPRICIIGRWLGSALDKYPEDVEGVAHNWRVPAFSASINAVMKLVPDGQGWAYLDRRAIVRLPGSMVHEFGEAATPALALTAAALRARAAEVGES